MGTQKVKCTIVSGAPNDDIDFLKEKIDKESYIIAADSGYKTCLLAGITPKLIIGDFDSAEIPKLDTEIIKLPVEKDDTDTFYSVKYAIEKGFSNIEIFSALGSRFDHSYANMLCLSYCADKKVSATIINKNNKLTVITDSITINNSEYEYFSVFSLLDKTLGVTIKDAFYPLNNYNLSSVDQVGESNHFKDLGTATISLKSGKLLIIQSND